MDDVLEAFEAVSACSLCGSELSWQMRSCHIDHDHKTGAFRGFLCQLCNMGLGMFRDDPALLRTAAEYMEAKNGDRLDFFT